MAPVRGIPQEILKFFQSPGGHSAIVKGAAGTGKTTFALQLAEELGGIGSSYYMSVRVSDTTLYNQFPWLKERLKAAETAVAGRHYIKTLGEEPVHTENETQVAVQIRVLGEMSAAKRGKPVDRKVDRTELQKLEGRIEMGEEGEETYQKLGEGEVTQDSLVFDLGSDLPEVDMAYDAVERNFPGKTLVVIDSIDGLSERYGLPASKLINTLQKDLVESSQANVLYVLESSVETRLDYLGDGVVSFRSEEYAGRRLRTMTIEKLRGSEVRQHKYLYTLDGGRLRAFEFPRTVRPPKAEKWSPIPDPSEDCVSTGQVALDALFGGLGKGSLVCVEIGENVAADFADELRTGLICNFAASGRGVAHVPPSGANTESVRQMVVPYIEASIFDRYVRVFEPAPLGTLDETGSAQHLEGTKVDSELKWSTIEYHLSKAGRPFLSLMSFDTLESVYGADVLTDLSGHIFSVRRKKDVFVGVCTATTKSNQKLADLAQIHVKLENLAGTLVLFCEKPRTELHYLSFDYSRGYPQVVLTPLI